jgi:hypothetical protein
VRELVDETRLADAGLSYNGDDLSVSLRRQSLRPPKMFQFGVPFDEARQPSPGRRLQPRPRHASPSRLVDLNGLDKGPSLARRQGI